MTLRARIGRWIGGKAPEGRSGVGAWAPPFSGSYLTPPYYGARNGAENVATVLSCVNAIASALASLPALIYERMPDGTRRERPDHPVARLIKRPNHLQTWADWVNFTMGSVLLYGNALSTLEWDGNGQPVALNPLPWWNAQPILLPTPPTEAMGSLAPSARLAFDTLRTVAPWGGTGVPRRYFVEDVFYLRDRSDTGILGVSRLSRAGMPLQQALSIQAYATSMWDNQATPPLALTHPGRLSTEAANRIAQAITNANAGTANARRALVLEEGMKPEALGINADDAQLLESRRFTAEEMCRVFNVPPPIAGIWDHSTFTNSATAAQWFAQFTLLPWVKLIEAEFARAVFNDPDRFFLELDMGGLTRGDYASMMATNIGAVRAGVMTADEARQEAGLDPRGGDADRLMPQAVGGRPDGSGEGDGLPPMPKPNGAAQPNGRAVA